MQEEGEKARKKEREKGAKEKREERKGEGSEGKEEERKKEREKGREGAREKGRVRIGKKASEGERALLASVVHVARALYMNVTQDVAVGLSCILCTTPPDYTEYHAHLRSIILNTMHDSD